MSKDWPRVRLGEVMALSSTATPCKQLAEINLAGVYSFGRGLFARGPISPAETIYKTYNMLVADDYVISQPKAWEGAIARVTAEFDGWYLSPVFPTLRANRSRLEPTFLEWFCRRGIVWAELQQNSRGIGARRETVSVATFLALEIPLPPLEEQRRIVARIDELAAKISEASALRCQATEETEKILPRTMTNIFEAMGYRRKTLAEVAEKKTGIAYKAEDFVDSGEVPVVRLKEIGTKQPTVYLQNPGNYANVWLEPGDIILAKTSFSTGAMCQWAGPPAVLNQNAVMLRAKDGLEQSFLSAWLGQQVTRYLDDHLADPNFYPYIREGDLLRWQVPLPPISEQRRIVAYLEGLQVQVDALKQLQAETATELNALLPAILNRAFKGEL